jgi:hypothetical protein
MDMKTLIEKCNFTLEMYQEPAATEATSELSLEILGIWYIPFLIEEKDGHYFIKTLQVPSADEVTFELSEMALSKYGEKCFYYFLHS